MWISSKEPGKRRIAQRSRSWGARKRGRIGLATSVQVAFGVVLLLVGVNAAVAFAGLTPGLTGLYQVNVTVPTGVTAGNQVPVVLAVDGEPAPPVTMGVK